MLKYLFTVKFKDGKILSQQEDDISAINPEKSSFFDVLEEERAGNPPVVFCIADGTNDYLVDLEDGHFEANGVKFYVNDRTKPVFNRRLIYFRRNVIDFTQYLEQVNRTITYKIGWQANDSEGNNVQHVIEVE